MDSPERKAATPLADSRNWGMISHLSAFVMFFGIPSIVGPLVVWALKKEDPYVDYHGKEAMNFNISFLLYGVVSAILILVAIGLVLLPLVGLVWFVLVIVGAVKASNGEYYRYPLTIRFIS
jgi:uncharacterized Tic20 family protein